MRYLITLFSIAVLSFLFTWFLPWWLMPVTAYALAFFMGLKPGRAFSAGFLAIFILWLLLLLSADLGNGGRLSQRMSGLFFLPHRYLFLLVNVLLGGLIGGLAAWSGALTRRAVIRKSPVPVMER